MRYVVLTAFILGWLALLPPLFTHGACDAEFDQEVAMVAASHAEFATPDLAKRFWDSQAVPASVLTVDQCRHRFLKFVDNCGPGVLVYAAAPVRNRICHFYRDDSITVQLNYDMRNHLARVETDMKPSKSLHLPWLDRTFYWGK